MKGQEHSMGQTDEELMKAYQRGDQNAMTYLFHNNKVRIFKFCFGLLGQRADAEEIAADVFLALIKNKQLYDPTRTFSTWIFTIARNLCFNRIRTRKQTVSMWQTTQGSDYEMMEFPDQNESPVQSLANQETSDQVKQAIKKLPYEQQEALVLKQYHGFSYAEISQVLNCSLEKVKILIFRAKERLKNDLSLLMGEESL